MGHSKEVPINVDVTKPRNLVPGSTTNHSNIRTLLWKGEALLDQIVFKTEYRKPHYGFQIRWKTNKSIKEATAKALDMYFSLKDKYGFPSNLVGMRRRRRAK